MNVGTYVHQNKFEYCMFLSNNIQHLFLAPLSYKCVAVYANHFSHKLMHISLETKTIFYKYSRYKKTYSLYVPTMCTLHLSSDQQNHN